MTTKGNLQFKRIVLKLSGEAFKGQREYGIDPIFLAYIAQEIKKIYALNIQIAIVIGGGNIFRGLAASQNGMDRVTADYSGMLATIMNALALQDFLKKQDIDCRVQSAIEMKEIAEPFIIGKALRHLDKNRIVIFAGGTGNPFFTTDTTAALRAVEISADCILKATKVNGIYDRDPELDSSAQFYDHIDYQEALNKDLKIMDKTAFSLSQENNIPIIVFNLAISGNIEQVVKGKKIGTYVGNPS